MNKLKNLEIVWLSPDTLTPCPVNPKLHPESQIDKLKQVIEHFGFDQPVVIDENNEIIKGHARREAAIRAGLELIPVIRRIGLSKEDKTALRLSDNRLAESDWDSEFLRMELQSLLDADFDLPLTGFDTDEIDSLLKEVESPDDFNEVDENKMRQELDITCPKCGFRISTKKSTS
ncbi:ParB/Srx family N-terminal domain-containing protein [Brasilonema sp. UFV-L1]|uniref:ParB/Srx family N-terminal domain-containing protein n=1 Tax=Brasilonema sp. UFV-L1 TaxID=2234130 RepID=UPI00145F1879|nr:ParB/Srx family N-terminal domain-containing protein [Brasilonema sp. UFV-L1]NMG09779.1 chromosome partitioning protein ParB [Brasilonema sp. UFV-L1]